MERPSVRAKIAGILTILGRSKHNLKRKRVYTLGIGILLLLALVAAGSSANAAGSTTKTSTNEVGQGSIRKDVLMVTGVSGHTINGKHKDGTTVNVITTTSTTFTRDGVSVSLSAVKVGEIIGVVGSSNDAWSISATHVEILVPEKPGPASDTAVGSITSITGTTITIQNDGKTTTIKTTATTRFFNKIEGKQVTLRDLKVGDFVFAEGILNNDSSLTADEVVAGIPPKGPQGDSGGGYITRITGTTITIQNGGKMATIKTTTTTRFGDKREGKQVTLADLKVGDFVYAVGTLNGDGSLTADIVVIVNPPGQS